VDPDPKEVIVSKSQPTTTRRTALQTALTGLLAAGAASMLPTVTSAAPEPTVLPPAATIDRAEALLLDFEQIMLQLDEVEQSDLGVELDRLSRVAGAYNPAEAAEDWPRNTGANRASLLWARGHALAHSEIIPKYGALIAVATAARKAHRNDFRAGEAAEAEIAQAYAEPKAADIERYGTVGSDAWHIAWSWALFGYCEECGDDGAERVTA